MVLGAALVARDADGNEPAATGVRTFRIGPDESRVYLAVERALLPPPTDEWPNAVSLVRIPFDFATKRPSKDFAVSGDNVVVGVGSYRAGHEGSIDRSVNGPALSRFSDYVDSGKRRHGLELRVRPPAAPGVLEMVLVDPERPSRTLIECWQRMADGVGQCRLEHAIATPAYVEVSFDYDRLERWRELLNLANGFAAPRLAIKP